MSFLSRLFGRRGSGKGPRDLQKRLESLEAEAKTAAPGYVGTAFNRAGDVALRGGESARAVEYYGRAIDAFLQDGQREAARGVANKIIRVRPGAVRTLCTLTWLDLAARHSATALLHLRDYVDAARAIDRTGLAASQIYEMARVVPESEFIGAVADSLDVLDFSNLADEVRGWVKSNGSPDAIPEPDELAEACLKAAIRSSQRGERSIEEEKKAQDRSDASSDDGAGREEDGAAERVRASDADDPPGGDEAAGDAEAGTRASSAEPDDRSKSSQGPRDERPEPADVAGRDAGAPPGGEGTKGGKKRSRKRRK